MPKITFALNVLLDSLILLDEKLMLISQTNFLKTRLDAHAWIYINNIVRHKSLLYGASSIL